MKLLPLLHSCETWVFWTFSRLFLKRITDADRNVNRGGFGQGCGATGNVDRVQYIPTNLQGTQRYMRKQYLNLVATTAEMGRPPDYFFTYTQKDQLSFGSDSFITLRD